MQKRGEIDGWYKLVHSKYIICLIVILLIAYCCNIYCSLEDKSKDRIADLKANSVKLNEDLTLIFQGLSQDTLLLKGSQISHNSLSRKLLIKTTVIPLTESLKLKYLSNQNLGALKIFDPVLDSVSGRKVLPLELIVKDNNLNLNIVRSVINIKELLGRLLLSLDENVEFLLLDSNNNIVSDVVEAPFFLSEDDMLRVNSLTTLDDAITFDNQKFYYIKKLRNYPYTILMGYSKVYLDRQIWTLLYPKILILISIITLLLCINSARKKLLS